MACTARMMTSTMKILIMSFVQTISSIAFRIIPINKIPIRTNPTIYVRRYGEDFMRSKRIKIVDGLFR